MVNNESQQENTRPFFISKDVLDTLNSVFWFGADAFWMLGSINTAIAFMIPTILTGLSLLYIEKRRPVLFINIAINCWIFMNTMWILTDVLSSDFIYIASRVFLGLGVLAMITAGFISNNLQDTFSHFRRFRGLKY